VYFEALIQLLKYPVIDGCHGNTIYINQLIVEKEMLINETEDESLHHKIIYNIC